MFTYLKKIPLTINPFFFLIAGLIGWLNASSVFGTVIWVAVILVSVLIHEMGHAATALFFGQQVEIELHGFGGVTRRFGPPLKLWQEFFIVLNGPLAGLALFFLSYQLYVSFADLFGGTFLYALQIAIYINLFWTIVNLLPVFPLDGGHLLRITLESVFGFSGVKASLLFSMVFAVLFGIFFMTFGAVVISLLFCLFAFESYRNWQALKEMTPQDNNEDMKKSLEEAQDLAAKGDTVAALQAFSIVRRKAKKGATYSLATEATAKILVEQGRFEEAYQLLFPEKKRLSYEAAALLQQLAYNTGRVDEAIELGNQAYRLNPNYHAAYINALCHAIKGEIEPAIGWLKTAYHLGVPDMEHLLKNKDFDHIRDSSSFKHLQKTIRQQ